MSKSPAFRVAQGSLASLLAFGVITGSGIGFVQAAEVPQSQSQSVAAPQTVETPEYTFSNTNTTPGAQGITVKGSEDVTFDETTQKLVVRNGAEITVKLSGLTQGTGNTSGGTATNPNGFYLMTAVDQGAGKLASPAIGGIDMSGGSGSSAWITNNPYPGSENIVKSIDQNGNAEFTLSVTASDDNTDCLDTGAAPNGCVLYLRTDHRQSANRAFDVRVPLTFNTAPVEQAPEITTQPQSVTADTGANVTFTAAASGNPEPTVKWQRSWDNGANWQDIKGATTSQLSLSSVKAYEHTDQFRAIFTNTEGTATSSAATLTLNGVTKATPAIQVLDASGQPLGDRNITGDSEEFTIKGSGFRPGQGVYVAQTIAKPAEGYPSVYGNAQWVGASEVSENGEFTKKLTVSKTFTPRGGSEVDATVTPTFIGVFNDHTAIANRTQDVWSGQLKFGTPAVPDVTVGTATITGTPQVSNVLTANTSGWAPADVSFTYEWLANGQPIAGETGETLTLTADHIGQKISVKVTGSKTDYNAKNLTSAETDVVTFKDVPTTDQFYKEIVWLANQGITTGWSDGTFKPVSKVNRDATAAFLYRLKGQPAFTAPATSPFKDVKTTDQYYKEITWLNQTGVTTGWNVNGGKEFRPVTPINRDAFAAFLYRLAGSPQYTPPATSPFKDVKTTDQYYKEIAWLSEKGISTGWDANGGKEFRPLNQINRDAVAAFLYRASTNNIIQ